MERARVFETWTASRASISERSGYIELIISAGRLGTIFDSCQWRSSDISGPAKLAADIING